MPSPSRFMGRKSIIASDSEIPQADEYGKELAQVLQTPPHNLLGMLPAAQQWMGEKGIVSDWHKNALILDALASIPYAKDVEIELNIPQKYLKYYIYINPFYFITHPRSFLGYKKDVVSRIREIIAMYVPQYNVDLEIRYGRSKNTELSSV